MQKKPSSGHLVCCAGPSLRHLRPLQFLLLSVGNQPQRIPRMQVSIANLSSQHTLIPHYPGRRIPGLQLALTFTPSLQCTRLQFPFPEARPTRP